MKATTAMAASPSATCRPFAPTSARPRVSLMPSAAPPWSRACRKERTRTHAGAGRRFMGEHQTRGLQEVGGDVVRPRLRALLGLATPAGAYQERGPPPPPP